MKGTIVFVLLGVLAGTRGDPIRHSRRGELEAKLEDDNNAALPRRANNNSEVIIEMGKRLQQYAHEINAIADQLNTADGEVSPYGWGSFFSKIKGALKDAAKEAIKAGGKQLVNEIKGIASETIREIRNGNSLYEMEDDAQPLSQFFKSVAQEVDSLGKALEIAGVVAKGVPA